MQPAKNIKKPSWLGLIIYSVIFAFYADPLLGIGLLALLVPIFIINRKKFIENFSEYIKKAGKIQNASADMEISPAASGIHGVLQTKLLEAVRTPGTPVLSAAPLARQTRLEKRKRYLHVALNSTLEDARDIISQLPVSDRILIEAGTPLIKTYGAEAVSRIKAMAPAGSYIVADNKCADLAAREVEMMAEAGANAATCLGVAPIETIDAFIEECGKRDIDSMIDMMNVEDAIAVLKKLKKLPDVVMLHRGVDESELSKEKQIPYYQIKQIKGNYNVLVAVAGGDTIKEAQRAIFNDADIVVVWKNFYQSSTETAAIAETFIKEIK